VTGGSSRSTSSPIGPALVDGVVVEVGGEMAGGAVGPRPPCVVVFGADDAAPGVAARGWPGVGE
jgi:hypothetical protein